MPRRKKKTPRRSKPRQLHKLNPKPWIRESKSGRSCFYSEAKDPNCPDWFDQSAAGKKAARKKRREIKASLAKMRIRVPLFGCVLDGNEFCAMVMAPQRLRKAREVGASSGGKNKNLELEKLRNATIEKKRNPASKLSFRQQARGIHGDWPMNECPRRPSQEYIRKYLAKLRKKNLS